MTDRQFTRILKMIYLLVEQAGTIEKAKEDILKLLDEQDRKEVQK